MAQIVQSDAGRFTLQEIWLIRHGVTRANRLGIIQGQSAEPLSSTGREQARKLGRWLVNHAPPTDALITSPLERTEQTTAIIARHLSIDPGAIDREPRLAERGFGDLEGSSTTEAYGAQAAADDPRNSPGAGATIIAESFFLQADPLLVGGGIADDGTVFYSDADQVHWKWTSDLGVPVSIGAGDGQCPGPGEFLAASPGGRAAATYGAGLFCGGGLGVIDWTDPDSAPRLSPTQVNIPAQDVCGINDAGLVCAATAWDGVVYDVEAGGIIIDTFSFSVGEEPLGIDENGWIMSTGGTLYRDGGYESLLDLLDGVDSVDHVYAQAEGGHFLARVTVGGDSTMAIIRPTGASVPGDTDGNGAVDFTDLVTVLNTWGPCDGCPADFDGDGVVGFSDLVVVLTGWS